MNEKPTLEELFQSKKLDLPEDGFWNGFQDRVKGRTMAALSQQSKSAKIRKAGIYAIVPVFLSVMVGWGFLNSNSIGNSQHTTLIETDQKIDHSELSSVLADASSTEREGTVQLAMIESFDSFANARIELAGGGENFHYNSLSFNQNTGSISQYTF